jgi:hypothetical protein
MNPDSTAIVNAVSSVVSNPFVIQWIGGIIASIAFYLIGRAKIPMKIARTIIEYAAIIVIAIIEAEQKSNQAVARTGIEITNEAKLDMAIAKAESAMPVLKQPKLINRIVGVFGDVASVVNVAYPIVKPFLRKK